MIWKARFRLKSSHTLCICMENMVALGKMVTGLTTHFLLIPMIHPMLQGAHVSTRR